VKTRVRSDGYCSIIKRCLYKLVVFLFLGAATSLVIAWSIAVYVQDRFQTRRDRLIDGYATYYSEWGSREQVDFHGVIVWTVYRFGAAQTGFELPETSIEWLGKVTAPALKPWSMRRILGPEFAQNGWLSFEDMGCGWPRIAMAHTWLDNTPTGVHQMFPDSIEVGRWNLPNRVVWSGFVVDTAFCAVIWFTLPWSFIQTRRAVRKRRGRCVNCGYDLRGTSSGGCAECGWQREGEA